MGGFQMGGPPEPIASDYVELVTLILLFIIGAPLNLAAYTQVCTYICNHSLSSDVIAR